MNEISDTSSLVKHLSNFSDSSGQRVSGRFMGRPLSKLNSLDQSSAKPLIDYIREPSQSFFSRKKSKCDILKWTSGSIKKPLTDLPRRMEEKMAIKCFRALQFAMGDRDSSSNSIHHIHFIVKSTLESPALRKEIYCQAIKQCTQNSNEKSLKIGWRHFCILLLFIPISKDLKLSLKETIDNLEILESDECEFIHICLQSKSESSNLNYIPEEEDIKFYFYCQLDHLVFGNSLNRIEKNVELMDGSIPKVLKFLCESVIKLGGCHTEGIFRIPGDWIKIAKLRINIEKSGFSTIGIDDPAIPASLLKLWLRQLCKPLIPSCFYESCIDGCTDAQKSKEIFNQLPGINQDCLLYLIAFIQTMGDNLYQKDTKMDINNLCMVFAPNILQCPSDNPLVILANSRREFLFIKTLVNLENVLQF